MPDSMHSPLDSGFGGLTESESMGAESFSAVNVEESSSEEESQPFLDPRQLQSVLEGLNQYSGWRVYPELLVKLMTAGVKVLRRGNE